ncbi:MAG: tetratricopeptide repeat protein, partial [Planctomycetota bacterium]
MKTRSWTAFLLLLILPVVLAGERDDAEARARAAYLDGNYDVGIALYRELAEKHGDGPGADRYAMLAVRGLSLATKHPEAAEAGEAFLAKYPQSRFREKIAYLTARELLLAGRGEDASSLMAASLGRLKAAEGRHQLARYYVEAADRAYAGRTPADPFDPGVPPDYAKALRLYGLARRIGLPADRKEELVLRIARVAARTKGWSLALEVLGSRDSEEALFLRGRARIGQKKVELAKEIFEQLLTKYADSKFAPEALFLLGTPDSLARLAETCPDHELAPRAGLRRGQIFADAGDADLAVAAWDETAGDFPESGLAPRAALAAADLLSKRSDRFHEAERRYRDFLRDFPDHADFARARDGLTRAWFARGQRLLAEKRTDEAAKVWAALREAYPLSPHAPRSLWQEARARKGEAATNLLRELVSRYPKSREAPRAALHVAGELEALPGRIADAVAALNRVIRLYPDSAEAKQAEGRIRIMKEKFLEVELPAPRTAGAAPALILRTRNISALSGRIYHLDTIRYFRKHGSLEGIDELMLEVIAPDARFTHEVEGYEDYRTIPGELPVPVTGPGTWVVVVEGGDLAAVGLLVVSEITLITKESPRGVLGFVQRADSGEPVEGATLLVRTAGGEVLEAVTGKDGVARLPFENRGGGVGVLATLGKSIAIDDHRGVARKLRGLSTRVHITTDRPVYRAGHTVRYRAVVRRASGGFFETPAGEAVRATVTDRAGNRLHTMEGKLSDFGTTDGEFVLPADLPPARYTIQVEFGGKTYRSPIEVRAYRKPQIFFEATPGKPDYLAGDRVTIEIRARYSFGRPVARLPVRSWVRTRRVGGKWGKSEHAPLTTDAAGVATIQVTTQPGEDREIEVNVQATDATRRHYGIRRTVIIPAAGFRASLESSLDTAFPGEEVRLVLRTTNAMGEPVAARGEIEVGRAPAASRDPAFSVVKKIPVETLETGRVEIDVAVDGIGRHRFLFTGVDRRGKVVRAEVRVEVIEGANRVVVRAERSEVHVGETARVTITSPVAGRHLLLTCEGEEVHGYRVIHLPETRNVIDVPITPELVPNIRIEGALAHDGRLYRGGDSLNVFERILVTVRPEKPEYGPGELCRLTVTTKKDTGDPVPA